MSSHTKCRALPQLLALGLVLGLALLGGGGDGAGSGSALYANPALLTRLFRDGTPVSALSSSASASASASAGVPVFERARPALTVSTFIGGGLTNQRIRLRQFLVLAAVKRLAVYLPEASPSREVFIREYNDPAKVGWHRLPFGEVFDAPRLTACMASLGVEVLGVCGAPVNCSTADTEVNSTPLLDLMRSEMVLGAPQGHVLLTGAPIFDQRSEDAFVADAVDECISYAPQLRLAAAQVWSAFLAAWRPRPGGGGGGGSGAGSTADLTTVGVHVRLEDDGAAYFGRGEMSTTLYRAAMLDRVAHCVRSHVPAGRAAPEALALYVASGEPLSSMGGLADEFPRISSKDSLAPPALGAIAHLFADAAAGVDHLVLLEADFFFGYYESTFSLQVANERFRRGRPSALHNAPWQNPAVCVRHQPFRNW